MISRPVKRGKSSSTEQTIGARLRVARERAGYTVRSAAEALSDLGVDKSDSTISAYENEHVAVTTSVLLAICNLYDASVLWVLTGLGPEGAYELMEWLEQPELYAIQEAVDRIKGALADAPAAVREGAAQYLARAGEDLVERE